MTKIEACEDKECRLPTRRSLVEVMSAFVILFVLMTIWRRTPIESWFLAFFLGSGIYCLVLSFFAVKHAFDPVSNGAFARAAVYGATIGAVLPGLLVLIYRFGSFRMPDTYEAFASFGAFGRIGLGFCLVLIGPILEELLFRGFFYSIIRNLLGVSWAAILSSSFFALVHPLSVSSFVVQFLHGLVFAWAYQKSRSIWGSVIAHAMNNASYLILFWLT
jgi:membrane protease YdiL (CAAX protease family)